MQKTFEWVVKSVKYLLYKVSSGFTSSITVNGDTYDPDETGNVDLGEIGGGGGSSLFPTTGTGTATGNVTGELDGHRLQATNSGNIVLDINAISGQEQSFLFSGDGTGSSTMGGASNIIDGYLFVNDAANGVNDVSIVGDATANTITSTAETINLNSELTTLNLYGTAGVERIIATAYSSEIEGGNANMSLYANSDGGYKFFLSADDTTNFINITGDAPDQTITYIAGNNTFRLPDSTILANFTSSNSYMRSFTSEGNGNGGVVSVSSSITSGDFELVAFFNDGDKAATINARADVNTSFVHYVADTHEFSGVLVVSTQYTPTSSTDNTYPNGSLTQDDSFLYYRTSTGDWVKSAWVPF